MKETKNIAHSVFERLKLKSKVEKISLDYMLLRYAIERFLYRIGISKHSAEFTLKGANLFYVWTGERARMTKDIDLLGVISPDIPKLRSVINEICLPDILKEDGLEFDTNKTEISEIREDQVYGGLRANLTCRLYTAVIKIQVDIGFGDSVYPEHEIIEFPSILDMKKPQLRSYSKYTVVAEKFEAMVQLGIANSRMKDFFDLWYIFTIFGFDGKILSESIERTFKRRGTDLPVTIPFCFTDEFIYNPQKNTQWAAFIKKSDMKVEVPGFGDVIHALSKLFMPIITTYSNGEEFTLNWDSKKLDWS
jgi:hypothetical protein